MASTSNLIKKEPIDEEENIFTFEDDHTVPDPIHDYPDSLQANSTPLIIDNGSCKCRVGWLTDKSPRLVFKNLVAKQRSKKTPQETLDVQTGNDIGNLEVVRWQLKSQFDRDVVTQYDTQEQIFDYTFSHLGINTSGSVDHPILLTEPVCNPNYSRNKMSELLFEGYHIPSVCYGIDAMFSLYKNHPLPETASSLVVACGYNTTHILPVLDGRLDIKHARRINVGGSHMETFLQKILQLKYPGHFAQISLSRAEEILHRHSSMAYDYSEELSHWVNEDYYCDHVYKYQLPYTAVATNLMVQEAQKERREQQIRRLKDLNAKKREEKLKENQEKLTELMMLNEMYEDEDDETFHRALQQFGVASVEELQETITNLGTSIQRIRYKILMEDMESKPIGNNLLGIPDEMLTSDQQEVKRRQKLMKSIEGESHAKNLAKAEKKMDLSDLVPDDDPEAMGEWIRRIRRQRQELLDKRTGRKQRKVDMTKRRTHASQQRMKIITELARGSRKKKDDNFGANDDDWNVYKQINKDAGDSDSEAEQEKLEEMETLLREYDPNFKDPNQVNPEVDVKEYYRIHVGVEKIRIPELVYQPSMIGLDQAGITETIAFVLSKYSPELQDKLTQHVFITGGCASIPNFKSRLERELMAVRPFQSSYSVHMAEDPILDAWYGARKWALESGFRSHCVSRADYEEYGGEYLKEHCASNFFTPTPHQPGKASPTKSAPPAAPQVVKVYEAPSEVPS